MVPRPHSGQLIFTCDFSAFSLIMALVVFVVLAMFLAFGDNAPHGIGPLLPKAQHTRVLGYLNWGANRDDAMIAAVTRDGRIYFGAEQIPSAADLPAKIQGSVSRGSERRVYIKADARA
jgi:biopolymer transport protein TolR